MQVDSQLTKLLISLLRRYNRVRVAGIGTISLIDRPAEIDDHTGIISPPSKEVVMKAADEGDLDLIDTVRSESLLHEPDLDLLTSHLSDKARELHEDGITHILGLGKITTSNDGTLHLSSSEINKHLVYEGWPTISLSRAKPEDLDVAEAQQEQTKKEEIPNTRSSVGTTISTNDADEFNWTHSMLPLGLLVGGLLLMIITFRYCQAKATLGGNAVEQPTYHSSPLSDQIQPSVIDDSADIFQNPILNKYQGILTQEIIDKGCLIVVGSFEDSTNAQMMRERVTSMGYDPLFIEYEMGTRVCVTFDCLDHDLLTYLKEIRSKVSVKAWYYRPEWEPEL